MPDCWPYWIATTTGTVNVTDATVWPEWVQATTASTDVWVSWTTTTTAGTVGNHFIQGSALPRETDRERMLRKNRERARKVRERVASRRAERLLLDHLDEQQQGEWREHKHFHVETADGRRRYRIALGLAGNVRLVRDGEQEACRNYCMHVYHPEGRVPNEDNVLAQKLLIEANEAEFLRLANVC